MLIVVEFNLTTTQKQRKKTEVAREEAEEFRKGAEEAKAIADKAYRVKFGMSVNQYLGLRKLELEKQRIEVIEKAIEKGAIQLNVIMGNAVPFTNIGK